MIKIKVLKYHLNIVLEDDKKVRRNCNPGEIISISDSSYSDEDVKIGLYRKVKNIIVKPDGQKVVRKKQQDDKVEEKLVSAVDSLQKAILGASAVLDELKKHTIENNEEPVDEVPANIEEEPVSVEEEEIDPENDPELVNPYTEQEYKTQHNRVQNIIALNINNDSDHSLINKTNVNPKLPLFAQANASKFTPQGSINIKRNASVSGQDILDKTPVELVNREDGKIDVFASLGAIVDKSGEE